MSTSYYRLKPPITSVRATVGGGHTQLGIWVNHAKAGEITLRNDEVRHFVCVLARDDVAVKRTYRGEAGGRVFEFFEDGVELDTPLISEYGEPCTLADLGLTPDQLKEHRL